MLKLKWAACLSHYYNLYTEALSLISSVRGRHYQGQTHVDPEGGPGPPWPKKKKFSK